MRLHQDSIDSVKLAHYLLKDMEQALPRKVFNTIHGALRRRDFAFIQNDLPEVALALLQGSPRTVTLKGVTSSLGSNPEAAAECLYAFSSLLKKVVFGKGETQRQAAINTFHEYEKQCAGINRTHKYQLSPYVLRAKEIIHRILGEIPSVETCVARGFFGPGVNVDVPNKYTQQASKFQSATCTITPLLFRAVKEYIGSFSDHSVVFYSGLQDLAFGQHLDFYLTPYNGVQTGRCGSRIVNKGVHALLYRRLKTVLYNKLAVVPKNSKTDRLIAAEPLWNSYFQNGVGAVIADKLRKFSPNVDINDQERNRKYAFIGSHEGKLATIDLSGASDTISLGLVKFLLPKPWYDLLYILRAPYYLLDGTVGKYEKFSSMGNGFTFPLETLIFYALTAACGKSEDVSVYGDDIVCNTERYNSVCKTLERCGFTPNRDKSFATGPFRESCGHDYYYGRYVRGVYLKKAMYEWYELPYLINSLTHENGLAWLKRWGISFCGTVGWLMKQAKHHDIPQGPFTGRIEDTFISMPDDLIEDKWVAWDDDSQRFVHTALRVTARKHVEIAEYGVALASYRNPGPGSFEPTLFTRVMRGLVQVKLPKPLSKCGSLGNHPTYHCGSVREDLVQQHERWDRFASGCLTPDVEFQTLRDPV